MKIDNDGFLAALRSLLSEEAEHLLDFRLQQMERDIADGWRAFYAREISFAELLPPPLINALGREYMVEKIRNAIWRTPGNDGSVYDSSFLKKLWADVGIRNSYRNFLDVGSLDVQGWSAGSALDCTANAVTLRRLQTAHANWWYETRAKEDDWFVESTARACLTPPLLVMECQSQHVAKDDLPLMERSATYWSTIHSAKWNILLAEHDYPAHISVHWNLVLMRQMAPDFPFDEKISSGKRLVFVQSGDSRRAWALMIDKTDGSPTFRYPPQIILIDRAQRKKLKDTDILLKNVLVEEFISHDKGPRSMETELLFHLPRSRRMIDFFTTFVVQAEEHEHSDYISRETK